jgi:hypothetical protein
MHPEHEWFFLHSGLLGTIDLQVSMVYCSFKAVPHLAWVWVAAG